MWVQVVCVGVWKNERDRVGKKKLGQCPWKGVVTAVGKTLQYAGWVGDVWGGGEKGGWNYSVRGRQNSRGRGEAFVVNVNSSRAKEGGARDIVDVEHES